MAGEYRLEIDQGSDTNIALTFYTDTSKTTPIDVSSKDFKMQIRENKEDKSFIDELSVTNTRIDMTDAGDGKITLKFPGEISSNYSFKIGHYDLYSYEGGVSLREMQGEVIVDRQVTK